MKETSRNWLTASAFTLWLKNGVDWKRGCFVESLSLEGQPLELPQRAMVQARQIYSLRTALELGCCDPQLGEQALKLGTQSLLARYSLPSGAFIHSVEPDGKPHRTLPDLYTQAFALFGLAHSHPQEPRFKDRALALVRYLERERRAPGGGFTELTETSVLFESNPHMHLFEAALAWMEIDPDPTWKKLADEVLELCLTRFIDSKTGLLVEHFHEGWKPIITSVAAVGRLDENGKFVFEPGHQYEWAWLLGRYQRLTGRDLGAIRARLFENSEKHGICPERGAVIDEVWSDFTIKSRTARFWPQCERIKAALQLGMEASPEKQASFARAADQAMKALFRFFDAPVAGLWYDTWQENGEFRLQPAKASSLYHIIGAISEYLRLRQNVAE